MAGNHTSHISADRLVRLAGANPERADKLVRHLLAHETGMDVSSFLSDKPALILPRDFIDGDLREGRTDLLVRLWPKDDEEIGFNVLLEHKDYRDPFVILQTMRYRHMAWTHEARHDGFVRRICTIIFYTGPHEWNPQRLMHGLAAPSSGALPFPYQPDPNAMPDFCIYDHMRNPNHPTEPALQVVFLALDLGAASTVSDGALRDLVHRVDRVQSARIPDADLILRGAMHYVGAKADLDVDRILRLASAGNRRWWERNMTTLVQRLHDEGREKGLTEGLTKGLTEGRAEGRAEGRTEGEANVLLKILERRFGEVPEGVAAQVRAADLEDIDRWVDAAFDADDIDGIFRNGTAR